MSITVFASSALAPDSGRTEASRVWRGELLKARKFSLQGNRKTKEGAENPNRDAQFGFINAAVETALAENQRSFVISKCPRQVVNLNSAPWAHGPSFLTPTPLWFI